jgi:hypothetical protein
MVKILIVERSGDISQSVYKLEDESELYKKAGYKSVVGFEKCVSWEVEGDNEKTYEYIVFGKKEGRANTENKYDFPPPIDELLLFNKCVIVKKRKGILKSLTIDEWEIVYEKLFGGFEDLDEESEMTEDEEDEYDNLPKTKSGYAQDGFIVEDEEDEDSNNENSMEEEFDSVSEDEEDNEQEGDLNTENAVFEKKYNTRQRTSNITNTVFMSLDDDYISDVSVE